MVSVIDVEDILYFLDDVSVIRQSELLRVKASLIQRSRGIYTELPTEQILGCCEGLPLLEEILKEAIADEAWKLSYTNRYFWLRSYIENKGITNGDEI